MSVKKMVIYVDSETGEVIRQRSFSHTPKAQQNPKQFFWLFYRIGERFPYSGSEIVAISRLVQNMGENNVLMRNRKDLISKAMLPLCVAEEKTLGYKRIKAWKQSGLLLETDGAFYLNSQVVRKGSLRSVNREELGNAGVRIVRICYDGIQEMAKGSMVRKLGKLVALLPYLNLEHNVLSDNIDELEWDKVEPLPPERIAAIWGNKTTSSRFVENYLLETRIQIRGHEQNIVKLVGEKYMINPRIFYGGSQFKEVLKNFSE